MKIATMTGAFRDYVAREDIASAVRLLAKCGYKHVDATLDVRTTGGNGRKAFARPAKRLAWILSRLMPRTDVLTKDRSVNGAFPC